MFKGFTLEKKKKEQESHHLIKTQEILKSWKLYFQLKAGFLIFLANTEAERSIKKISFIQGTGGGNWKKYTVNKFN